MLGVFQGTLLWTSFFDRIGAFEYDCDVNLVNQGSLSCETDSDLMRAYVRRRFFSMNFF